MQHSPRFLALTDVVRATIPECTMADLPSLRAAWPSLVFIDVREDSEWAAGHPEGAVHIGRGVLERDIEGRFPDPATPMVLICGGGYRSALAARSLIEMGYGRVWSLAGGVRAWQATGAPWSAQISA